MKKLTPEMMDALNGALVGNVYAKAGHGAQRAGRTRSIQALLKRGLLETSKVGFGVALTDAGRRTLETGARRDG